MSLDLSAARLSELGNLSIQQSIENSGRLSAMFGMRAAQANPIESAAIGSLDRSAANGDALMEALVVALAAIIVNLSNQTPKATTTTVVAPVK